VGERKCYDKLTVYIIEEELEQMIAIHALLNASQTAKFYDMIY
jgi:hypothetical protein